MIDLLRRAFGRLGRISGRRSPLVFYDPAYRLPIAEIEAATGMDPRRADHAAWYLVERGAIGREDLRTPARVGYAEMGRVHDPEYLESLADPATLARIFAADPSDIAPDELMGVIRVACGGTLDAARAALAGGRSTMNLLGGFHHAAPDRGGGLSAVNDIAVALATVRAEGFSGRAVVLDFDAHPPDGTARCLASDPSAFLGSISGVEWERLPNVDETVLPKGAGDDEYLRALEALLARTPEPDLAFVVAGGDVLAGDRLGQLGLTVDGARRRDARVREALRDKPSVWLPGGGYHADAWRVLVGTGFVLCGLAKAGIPADLDPLRERFAELATTLSVVQLRGSADLRQEDVHEALGQSAARRRLLDFYTAEGIEYALWRYGVLPHLERLGYGPFRGGIDHDERGDRMRLFGRAGGEEHLLIECVLDRHVLLEKPMLFVHWLTLRNPRGKFGAARPRLPGQDVPGLGMARDILELLGRMAERLGLAGVAYRPAYYHTAYPAKDRMRFVDSGREGRFRAMLRDFVGVPLIEATRAVSEGRVRKNGEPYAWEADDMAFWLAEPPDDAAAVAAECDRVRFTIDPPAGEETLPEAAGR